MNKPQSIKEEKEIIPDRELTREQRRKKERIEFEAHQAYTQLTGKYFQVFMDSDDPEGYDMKIKAKEMNSKWITYCNAHSLNDKAKKMFSEYTDKVLEDYKTNMKQDIDTGNL